MIQPIIAERLILRIFTHDDAQRVHELLTDGQIGQYLGMLPDPYLLEDAESWISMQKPHQENGIGFTFAITDKQNSQIIGTVSLAPLNPQHRHAELGYWLGTDYWCQGYATEATQAILAYGFTNLDLLRIYAHHLPQNQASRNILNKLGMQQEGVLRKHINHRGKQSDLIVCSILQHDWQENNYSSIKPITTDS
ncbi:GNAT family N-acetyltransferase [Planctomycetota bacterium]|nr:GNAT family N-acetyltransferase [Planctomycetota bacterium]